MLPSLTSLVSTGCVLHKVTKNFPLHLILVDRSRSLHNGLRLFFVLTKSYVYRNIIYIMNEHRLRGFIKTCRAAGLNAQETTALMSLHKIAGEFDTRPAYRRAFFKTAAQLAQQHGIKEAAAPGGAGTFWGSGAGHALAGAGVSSLLALLFSGRGNRIRNSILAFLGGGAAMFGVHQMTGGLHQNDVLRSLFGAGPAGGAPEGGGSGGTPPEGGYVDPLTRAITNDRTGLITPPEADESAGGGFSFIPGVRDTLNEATQTLRGDSVLATPGIGSYDPLNPQNFSDTIGRISGVPDDINDPRSRMPQSNP